MKTTIAVLCAVLCAWPVAGVLAGDGAAGSHLFVVHTKGDSDTSRVFNLGDYRKFVAHLNDVRPDKFDAVDSLWLTGQYKFRHHNNQAGAGTTLGQTAWKDFGVFKYNVSVDSLVANWPKTFSFSDADSTVYGSEVRFILTVKNDAAETADSLRNPVGAAWMLNVRGIR